MTAHENDREQLPPDLPPLDLTVGEASPADWNRILRRARLRRRKLVGATVAAVVTVATLPAVALLPEPQDQAPPPAHALASGYNGVCDVPYDMAAPAGDRIVHPFRSGRYLISPPGPNAPAIDAATLRSRIERRTPELLKPGSQLRYGVVRRVNAAGRALGPQLRWIVTTCGVPNHVPTEPFTPPPASPPPTTQVLTDTITLVSDSGAYTDGSQAPSFAGVCATRLDTRAPDEPIRSEFHVGEIKVTPPAKTALLAGRDAARQAARARFGMFTGTQVRLGLVEPLHEAGTPRLRWVVTTCGLDGASVRPPLPGQINEALVFDSAGRLLEAHRSGPRSEGERYVRQNPLPNVIPTYTPPGPNICGPWSHAYPDFKQKAAADGYTDIQGCSRTHESIIIFVSNPTRGAAAAVLTSSGKTYSDQYAARFPYPLFRFVPAPDGATKATLLRYLTARVAEVELSGPSLPARSHKFDARELRWVDCTDTAATRQPCRGR